MSAIDPASKIRPDWWSDNTYLHLVALEDEALPNRGLSGSEEDHATLPTLKHLLRAVWWLGKTGGSEDLTVEALRIVECNALTAARAARLTLSRVTDREEDDELAEHERACECDPNYGAPPARLAAATFTVRLPGFSGDTVRASIHVDSTGALTIDGTGPLADLDLLGRLDSREVIDAIENLVSRQVERPPAVGAEAPTGQNS